MHVGALGAPLVDLGLELVPALPSEVAQEGQTLEAGDTLLHAGLQHAHIMITQEEAGFLHGAVVVVKPCDHAKLLGNVAHVGELFERLQNISKPCSDHPGVHAFAG